MSDKNAELLERIGSVASKDDFDKLRLEIEEQNIVLQSRALEQIRTAWFKRGITQFRTEFVDVIVGEQGKGNHIPFIPIEGPDELLMPWATMSMYLKPEYLGIKGYDSMITIVAESITLLMTAIEGRTEIKATWSQRLLSLIPTADPESPEPNQPVVA